MSYLLDTDTCIFALKQHPAVKSAMSSKRRSAVNVSVITVGELRTGAMKGSAPKKAHRLVESFLRPLQIVELAARDTQTYATVRTALERAGTPIGPLDTWIAAHALSRGLVLVTNNQREFARVTGLRLENWA